MVNMKFQLTRNEEATINFAQGAGFGSLYIRKKENEIVVTLTVKGKEVYVLRLRGDGDLLAVTKDLFCNGGG